ncbi:hypothetical protein A6B43_04945 [Vespertiliibacter pulmonis]|uniref:Uncharacterized protein YcfL n=1 Tax=Vespertiliibacter pulmonis TaxID=1443036 RepID=A0A3N4WEA3_9PAST|nr:YcfL family protein [Vespertiliibacter pulmonis]QLB20918.1 hypothetical protein A6B43_04945 [Vespertiliibacter pulmonis]RPE83574.1 uncharacterized protein YcfL [Vespertiliibacter pulmonis]
MKKNFAFIALFSAFLTACSNNPTSYLPSGTKPIVNMELPLAEQVNVTAEPFLLRVANLTAQPLNVQYKLFWYDEQGVTQTLDPSERTPWHNFWVEPRSKTEMNLAKPTPESANYRVYLRNSR